MGPGIFPAGAEPLSCIPGPGAKFSDMHVCIFKPLCPSVSSTNFRLKRFETKLLTTHASFFFLLVLKRYSTTLGVHDYTVCITCADVTHGEPACEVYREDGHGSHAGSVILCEALVHPQIFISKEVPEPVR